MKSLENVQMKSKGNAKMTLKGYYMQLPDSYHPKTEFVNELANECGVSVTTVRNWVVYGMKPSNRKCLEILSKKTGIAIENLWDE